LHVYPAGFVIFPSAMPVDVEAEDVIVEVVFGRTVVNDQSGMDQPGADFGFGPRGRKWVTALNESDSMALRVNHFEPLTFVIQTKDLARLNAVSLQITLKA
jgi:hypothetical protein